MTQGGATIRRARLPAALAVPAGRALLQRWLSEVQPQHYGLPAEALVVVRRAQACAASLSDRSGPRARDPLTQALRGALRPVNGDGVGVGVGASVGAGVAGSVGANVGANVGAVWFANEAELLACMARDALHHSPHQRWWWPLVLGTAPDLHAMQARWCASARAVPQALAQLAAWGDDAAWLRLLQTPGRAALLTALVRHHPVGAAAVRCVQDSERRALAANANQPPSAPRPAGLPVGAGDPPPTDPVPVLLRLAELLRTEPQRALGEEVAALLDDGAAGRDAPGLSLLPGSRPSLSPPRSLPISPAISPPMSPLALTPLGLPGVGSESAGALPAAAPGPMRGTDAGGPAQPGHPDARAAPGGAAWRQFEAARPDPQPVSPTTRAAQADLADLADARSPPQRAPAAMPAWPPRSEPGPHATPISSDFGGLFFLLNVALAASFYGDFTRPRHAGLPVSPWRFLHAAGVACFGRAFKADPLAGLLVRLMPSGTGLKALPPAPASWRLDAACLRPYAADRRPWHVLRSAAHLRIVHPAGFVLAQGASDADLQAVLAQAPGLVWHPVGRLSVHGQGLLGLLWPWLARRLALALGLPAARPALNVATHLALRRPARVAFMGEQLHLHFSLSALPLAVRLAGLDRDPGWVPAAGCDVRFHFD